MNKKIIIGIIGAVILVAIIGLFGRSSQNNLSSSQPIKVGAALALTGDAASWGEESLKAAQLAIDEINDKGGINGKKFELVVEDMKSSSKDSVLAVSKLVNVDKVRAVMITWLDSYPGSESVVPENIPLISQDAAIESVNVPVNHSNVFSLWYRTSSKAEVTMSAVEDSQVKNIYIVLQHDPYYTKLAEFLKNEADKQGIQVVGQEFINPGDDSRSIIAKIGSAKPDAVFFGSYDEKLSVDFLKRYYQQIKGPRLFGDEFIEQDLDNKNFNPEWLEGITYYVPADPDRSFATKFNSRFGHMPKFSAQTTYDTVFVIAEYLKDNPQDLSSYMKNSNFNTLTYGKIKFDSIGGVVSNVPAIAVKIIRDGKPNPIK